MEIKLLINYLLWASDYLCSQKIFEGQLWALVLKISKYGAPEAARSNTEVFTQRLHYIVRCKCLS